MTRVGKDGMGASDNDKVRELVAVLRGETSRLPITYARQAARLIEKLAALPDKWWRESESRFGERIRLKYELEVRAAIAEVFDEEV